MDCRPHRILTRPFVTIVKHIVFLFEKVVKLLPPDVEQVVVIIDFHKYFPSFSFLFSFFFK